MPSITAFFWLYGYASHLLLVKTMVAIKGRQGDQNTAVLLAICWNLAKLFWAGIDYLHELCTNRRRLKVRLKDSQQQEAFYRPVSSPAYFMHRHAVSSLSDDNSDDEFSQEAEASITSSRKLHFCQLCSGRCTCRDTLIRDELFDPSLSHEYRGRVPWWFIWVMSGGLEMVGLIVTFKALEYTFVSKCQVNRNWAIIFIAIMQMLFEDETLVHSVVGFALVLIGLCSALITGFFPEENVPENRYIETRQGTLIAFIAGLLFSLQMFIHELLLDLMPTAGRASLLWESLGAIYLAVSIYPMLSELHVADLANGLLNLKEHYLLLLWYCGSSLIGIGSNFYNRKKSSPFARSVAFILQLPIVYVTEALILKWRKPRVIDAFTITCFLVGFLITTASIPFIWFGGWFHDCMFTTAFYRPEITSRMGKFFQTFHPDLRRVVGPIGGTHDVQLSREPNSPLDGWQSPLRRSSIFDDISLEAYERRNSLADCSPT